MLPFHSSAKVDSLLALDPSPEYMKDFDMTKSILFRYIQDEKDKPDIKILEIAGDEHHHFFVWSFSRPKTDFHTSPDGRVALSGEFVAEDDKFNCTGDDVSKLVHMHMARTDEQFFQGRSRVTSLEDTQEMKAWQVKVHERFNYAVERQVNPTKDATSF
ncbi:uncharacterized protein Triagg1_250 [Trichoderma aggressivum f. europaeum]|uniref:Uncharacterized protein n=1 Tax=Trichoderma aggressivum f. europaeum TaxID=173218 RepID=A0AAE1ILQ4_9HYPO|nr:hypothetical protein Triagg1_250 [Trichoderma aggressivum f. europaeum]